MDIPIFLVVLVSLALLVGGGGYYISRPTYTGTGARLGGILYGLAAIFVIAIVLRLLRMI
jgi:hypothetical protein